MAVHTRGLTPEVFEARQAQLFFKEYDAEPQHYTQVFNVMRSNKAYEDWFEVTGIGSFRLKAEGTPITYDVPVQGPRRRVVHQTFALGYTATKEAMADAQYEVIDAQASDLGVAGREHQDILAFAAVDDFFSGATYTTPDGLSVVNTAHVILKPKGSTTTNSNKVNPGVALSATGLELGITLMRLTKSREDRFIPNLKPKTLLIHPSKEHRAYELLQTEFKVDSQENNKNTVASSRTGMVAMGVPYLSSEDDWFVFAEKGKHKATWHARQDMEFDSGTDYQTKNKMFDASYRASIAIKDYRGIVGSDV
jgi:phage major head subunit gpT-like protein